MHATKLPTSNKVAWSIMGAEILIEMSECMFRAARSLALQQRTQAASFPFSDAGFGEASACSAEAGSGQRAQREPSAQRKHAQRPATFWQILGSCRLLPPRWHIAGGHSPSSSTVGVLRATG